LANATRDQLIVHALQALTGCVSGDDELTPDNGSIVVVGNDIPYTMIEGTDLQPFLDQLETRETPDDDDDGDAPDEAESPLVPEPQAMET
jgi:20S proteasome subunit alpha 6